MNVIVMQAISGAGKSSWIRDNFPKAERFDSGLPVSELMVSADHFFDKKKEYDFDASKLPQAHGACFREFIEVVQDKIVRVMHTKTIIVDNTNTSIAELAPYCAAALAYGHELKIVTLLCDPAIAHARNTHGVPLAAVMGQHERLMKNLDEIPPWWTREEIRTDGDVD